MEQIEFRVATPPVAGPSWTGAARKAKTTYQTLQWWVVGDEDYTADEGCLSVPGPYEALARATKATVRGVDKTGAAIEVSPRPDRWIATFDSPRRGRHSD